MAQIVQPTSPAKGDDANDVAVKQEPETVSPVKKAAPVKKPRGKSVAVLARNLLSIAVLLSSLFFFLITNKPENDPNNFDVVNAARYHLCPYSPIKIPLLCPQLPPSPYCTHNNCTSPWQDKSKVEDAVFGRLMDEVAGGSALSSLIQEAQTVISDLAYDIQSSDFTQKGRLAKEIAKLRADAGKTGKALQTFSKKVDGALDKVLTINGWALKTIEEARSRPYERLLQLLIPKRQTTQDVVTKTFEDTIDILTSSLEQLILEAERNDIDLQGMLNGMDGIRDILGREKGVFINEEIFGDNKAVLLRAKRNLDLLKDIEKQSRKGRERIHSSLFILRELSGELEVLRQKVAEATLLQMLPVEKHIGSIAEGLERLKQLRRIADKMQQEKMKTMLHQPVSSASPSTTDDSADPST